MSIITSFMMDIREREENAMPRPLTQNQRDRVTAALHALGLIKRGRPSQERREAEEELERLVLRVDAAAWSEKK